MQRTSKRADPVTIQKVRNEHGTRIARRIVCIECGADDTVHFIPRDPATVRCRKCAYEQLSVHDPDDSALHQHGYNCTRCRRPFSLDKPAKDPATVLCSDCFHGIESKQQNRTQKGKRVSADIVRVNRRRR